MFGCQPLTQADYYIVAGKKSQQHACDLPIFKASEVTLQVLRQKTGNCGSFRRDDATVVLPGEGAGAALRHGASRHGFCPLLGQV